MLGDSSQKCWGIRARNADGGFEQEMLGDSNQKCWGIRARNVGGFQLRNAIFLITTTAEVSKTNPLRSWIGHCRSGGCHLPTIHDRTRTGRPAVLQSTRVESESCQRTSSPDNRHSVDSLHTPRCHDHTWDDLPLSHTPPH